MKRAELGKYDAVIWSKDVRRGDFYYEIVCDEGVLAIKDTLEEAKKYCIEKGLSYAIGDDCED